MRAELQTLVSQIKQSIELLRRRLDWDTAQKRLDELDALTEAPDFWNDSGAARRLMRERNRLGKSITDITELETDLADTIELAELAEMDDDAALSDEVDITFNAMAKRSRSAELEALLSGETDANDAYIEIHAGAGGTESQDWANMLLRMYSRWANSRGFKVELIEQQNGDEAGIKSSTILVKGENAYGWSKTESGVHRLVRISPFDSASKRHTSFSSVWVYPVLDDNIEVDIEEKDVRTDTYRASGAGGQHINKTDSAVRLTHMPTGIVVQCQNDRSQHKNRATAWDMLRARLYEKAMQEREAEAQETEDNKSEIGWGHQIRSYVLQPYQMVKDLRTNVETSNTQAVLDGDLDQFMAASLAARVGGEAKE
ncbi:MAG: peptide chain release factor 2 [Robiginitomaculum sp.]|nr:peptide chain release factor 2 [Robiginitomaculum sp.]